MASNENIWRLHDKIVCPMDSVKPLNRRRGWSPEQVADCNSTRFEDLIMAGWDLIIVDAAHRLGGSMDAVEQYRRHHRILLLKRIVDSLRNDQRFSAAWLTGRSWTRLDSKAVIPADGA